MCSILLFATNRVGSKRATVGSAESQQVYPTTVDSYGQTGLSTSVSSCEDFAKNIQTRRGYIYSNGKHYKLSIDKATVLQLFKAVVKASDELNEVSFLHGQGKLQLQVQPMAQASEFYVLNIFNDRIVLTTNGHPDIRGWSDIEFANTKFRWESLRIADSSLL